MMCSMERFAIIAHNVSSTNRVLLAAASRLGLDASIITPDEAVRRLRPGQIALGRLDVLHTLAGPELGLNELGVLDEREVVVLNRAGALLAAHDKLMTALKLSVRAVPHPRTAHLDTAADPAFGFPVVVKPRFGSWGHDVTVCGSRFELEQCLRALSHRTWFRRQGALVQQLIEPQGHDLRILVAAGQVVGAVRRVARRGEWRTNVTVGGTRLPVDPPPQARLIALGAAAALGADFVGVDLLPSGDDRWIVLEVNGAVDFTDEYSLDGRCVFKRVVQTLVCAVRGETESSEEDISELSGEPLLGAPIAQAGTA